MRFDDDTLTNKVLDFVAAQQGMTKADIANQAKAIVPFMMAQLNNPELTAAVSAAVNAYLDNPKSLTIARRAGAAVPLAVRRPATAARRTLLPQLAGASLSSRSTAVNPCVALCRS